MSKKWVNILEESVGKLITEEEFDKLAEKKMLASKVKSDIKFGLASKLALVRGSKKGAKNWGNKSK